jgi:uncharacterized damage-inducible protein DinB
MISDKNPLLVSQIKFWREQLKPSILKSLECSPDDKLNWAPATGMITLGNLYSHISECSEWWFDQVVCGGKSERARTAPQSPVLSKAGISNYMDAHWERLERFFAADPSILTKSYKVSGRDKTHKFDGYWIFTHLLEHDIHHRSQINQYLRILGITPPNIMNIGCN